MAIFPFVVGKAGLRLEDARRNCGVPPRAVLRLEADLLLIKMGVDCCLSPRYELATEGDREGEFGETDLVFKLFAEGFRYGLRIGEEGGSGTEAAAFRSERLYCFT